MAEDLGGYISFAERFKRRGIHCIAFRHETGKNFLACTTLLPGKVADEEVVSTIEAAELRPGEEKKYQAALRKVSRIFDISPLVDIQDGEEYERIGFQKAWGGHITR